MASTRSSTPTLQNDFRLSVRQLECIVAVADSLSFRRAAETLGIAQPALSTHVAAAEGILHAQLFERDRRSVLITALGRDVVAAARLALAAIDVVSDTARAGSEPLTGPLRLGVIPTIAPYWLPALLPTVRQQFPNLMLILREDQTHRLLEQLSGGEIDVALLALPVAGDFTAKPICDEEFVLAASRTLRPNARVRIHPADLDAETMLLLEDGHCLRDQALAVCSSGGAAPSMSVRATSLPTLIQMVAGNLGSTLLPEMSVPSLVPGKKAAVTIERFARPAPTRTLGLLWRTSSGRLKEFRMLGDALAERATTVLKELRNG